MQAGYALLLFQVHRRPDTQGSWYVHQVAGQDVFDETRTTGEQINFPPRQAFYLIRYMRTSHLCTYLRLMRWLNAL
jgi:hypothetical protein